MRLIKTPNGSMFLEFLPPERHLLLQILAGFDAHDAKSRENIEQAKAEVIFAILEDEKETDKGNETVN